MKTWFREWAKKFWNKHGERLFYITATAIGATILYAYIPDTRKEVIPIYFILIGLLINKARSPEEKEGDAPDETIQ